jgi:hypothetical protein
MDPQRPGWNPPGEPTGLGAEPVAPAAHATETLASPARPRSKARTATIGVLAGVGALALAGTAYAATTSPTPSPSGSGSAPSAPSAPGSPGEDAAPPMMGDGDGDVEGEARRGPGGHHGRGGFGGPGMGIHGTFVVPKADGGYQTVHTQAGEVTAVSTTSITVTSEDDYTKSYTVTADTVVNAQRDGIGSIEVGDTVRVLGIEADGGVSAVQISDRTRIEKGMERLAPPAPDSDDTDGGTGTGTASPSSST